MSDRRSASLLSMGSAMGTAVLLALCVGCDSQQEVPLPRAEAAGITLNGKLVVIGGLTKGGKFTKTVDELEPASRTWRRLAPMPGARAMAGAALVGGRIYVIGGRDADEVGENVLVYEPAADRWSELAVELPPLWNHAVVTLGDVVYVLGGITGTSDRRALRTEVYAWTPATNEVVRRAPLPVPVQGAAGLVFRDRIWMIGGRRILGGAGAAGSTLQEHVQIYDPVADNWSFGDTLARARTNAAAVVAGGSIQVLGGSVGGSVLGDVEVLLRGHLPEVDPASAQFDQLGTFQVGRTGHVAAAFNDMIYLVGGATHESPFTVTDDVEVVPPTDPSGPYQ